MSPKVYKKFSEMGWETNEFISETERVGKSKAGILSAL